MIQLIGMLDSPFVRRVAISMRLLGIPFEHKVLSVFRHYEQFRTINPLVKVPTLVLEDGQVMVESELILAQMEELAGRSLLPSEPRERLLERRIIGMAQVAAEKSVQLVYETQRRPEDKRLPSWSQRLQEQIHGAYALLEENWVNRPSAWQAVAQRGDAALSSACIITACAWRFTQAYLPGVVDPRTHPGLATLSTAAEQTAAFRFAPFGEGQVVP